MTKQELFAKIQTRIDTEADKYFEEVFAKHIKDFAEARRLNPTITRKQHIKDMLQCYKAAENSVVEELAESLNNDGLIEID